MNVKEAKIQFFDWAVLLYEAKPGVIFCPVCNKICKSVIGGVLPPYWCESDKIFFDACLDTGLLEKRKVFAGRFHCGDLDEFFMRHLMVSVILNGK
jgi:hypothetical protein